ncbi:MAG TPA: NHL repeat-containing protein [Chitinispirillaceae bacterium]|nr:NHL repeat-containing protein [Chitinispirillaceae bacterium]
MKKLLLLILITEAAMCKSLVFPPYKHSYGIRKATPAHLFMFFGPRTRFDDPQGLATTRLETWDDPSTEKDDDEVVVYGVNSGQHEIIYNTSMWGLDLYGKKGSGEGQFLFPKGIAADSKGNVIVADSGNNRVVHLFNPRSKLRWKAAYYARESSGGFKGPSRVALDEKGDIYVADRGNSRIVILSKDGDVKQAIPSHNKFTFENGPTALAMADGSAKWSFFRREKIIFCADKGGKRVWKLDLNGNVLKKTSLPDGYSACYGAIDYYHNYWITDKNRHCVLKFDHDLNLLDIFGSHGTGDNQFVEPRGITIYKRYGQVFIAEQKGAQYYWIGTELKSASLNSAQNVPYELTIKATEYSFVSLFSLNGADTVYYMIRRMTLPPVFTLPVLTEKKLVPGNQVILKIEPTYSSYTYNAWFYPVTIN